MAVQGLRAKCAPFPGQYSYLGINFRPYFPFSHEQDTQYPAQEVCDLFTGREIEDHGRDTRPSREDAFRSVLFQAKSHVELSQLDHNIWGSLNRIAPGWRTVDIPRILYRDDSTLVAFDDSWSAVSWSHWWTKDRRADPSVQVVLLHADDHKDLTSPFLLQVGEQWRDPLTNRNVSFADPESVASAVLSGSIGIGCFIVPLVHTVRSVQIRHLRAFALPATASRIERALSTDIRFVPTARRLAVREEPSDPQSETDDSGSYLSTNDTDLWLANIPNNAAILLHIDLDYFNDRYGGGWDAQEIEPTEMEMIRRVNHFCEALSGSGLQRRIENTTIALSPGFCPSEYWQLLLKTLTAGLRQIGCSCLRGLAT